MFRFSEPEWLIALTVLPLVWRFSFCRRSYIVYPNLQILKHALPGRSRWPYCRAFLQTLTIVSIVCALARPQMGFCKKEAFREGVDIFFCIDTSGSMAALDFDAKGADRLTIVKETVTDLIRARTGDRLGVAVFAKEAFTLSPLTLSHASLLRLVEQIKVGLAGEMTALGPALVLCTKNLRATDTKSKVIILLTDGRQNAGSISPLKGAYLAKALGIKIYAVGLGSPGTAPFKEKTPLGERIVYRRTDTDEGTLRQVAAVTGGIYSHARSKVALAAICRKIDRMERTRFGVREVSSYREIYSWFIISGLLFFGLTEVLSHTRFRQIP